MLNLETLYLNINNPIPEFEQSCLNNVVIEGITFSETNFDVYVKYINDLLLKNSRQVFSIKINNEIKSGDDLVILNTLCSKLVLSINRVYKMEYISFGDRLPSGLSSKNQVKLYVSRV